MEYSNKELAKLLGINLAKQRRHAREFLGVDPEAGQSSGKERMLTLEDAFIVYLCGLAVNHHSVPLEEAKRMSRILPEWLVSVGYFPIDDYLKNRGKESWSEIEFDDGTVTGYPVGETNWTLCVTKTAKGYRLIAKGAGKDGHEWLNREKKISYVIEHYNLVRLCDDDPGWEERNIHTSFIPVYPTLKEFAEKIGINKKG
ncbi:hypothetical protein [Desulfofustis glycolicus]|uniref:Uncharacterized protein n=1 Tax=Desulfofustis glycolicus DSM 9705 TaxID=1121409 RepID=A0A1M5XQ76_9BACT|nr:hypothetical protein [Desulfofustis glycolicus]SHI01909.1 hypothetical protein SAMN02745124_03243 [Desulfofustis glycolicus DSM 9705]